MIDDDIPTLDRERFLPKFILRALADLRSKVAVVLADSPNHAFMELLKDHGLLAGVFALEPSEVKVTGTSMGHVRPITEIADLPKDTVGVLCAQHNATVNMAILVELRSKFQFRFLMYADLTSGFDLFNAAFHKLEPYHPLDLVARCHFGEKLYGPEELYTTVPLEGKTVLELGPLDTSMSGSILQYNPASLTVLDSYWANFLKCHIAKRSFCLHNFEIILGDFHQVVKETFGTFDVLYAHGVLYHSPEVLHLCEQLSEVSSSIVVGVHCMLPDTDSDKTRVFHWQGREWRAEVAGDTSSASGGPGTQLHYFSQDDWQRIFTTLGYEVKNIKLTTAAKRTFTGKEYKHRDYYQFAALK